MSAPVILLDIDGCIADDAWRISKIDWSAQDPFARYHTYHTLGPWDSAGNTDLFMHREEQIVMITSRPVFYRTVTEQWLRRQAVHYSHLIMRNNGDHRPSTAIKRAAVLGLHNYGIALEQVVCAYDDRPEIVAMYLELGINAEVRALHAVSAYHDPKTGVNHADGSKCK